MKQATVKMPSGEFIFAQTEPGYFGYEIMQLKAGGFGLILRDRVGDTKLVCKLSSPNWQLLGADPTNLTEVEAGEIVERDWNGAHQWYKDYLNPDTRVKVRPTTSLSSLAQSLGIEKPFVVLKNK